MAFSTETLVAVRKFEHLVFIVGMSGAGKTTASNAFSDSGYFVVDNLPVTLAQSFFLLCAQDEEKFQRAALLLTIDNAFQLNLLLELLTILRGEIGSKAELLFLDCESDVILRRYNETRRPHPFFKFGEHLDLQDVIALERQLLFPARESAQCVIDTSRFTVHDVKQDIRSFLARSTITHAQHLTVHIMSFGFKYGAPFDCNLILDVRFLPNPYFSPSLRNHSGKEVAVRAFIFQDGSADLYLEQAESFLRHSLQGFHKEGRAYAKIGIGCTGGRHRSVALAEELSSRLVQQSFLFFLTHRDIEKIN